MRQRKNLRIWNLKRLRYHGERITMRLVLHYLFTIAILTIYGGQV